MSEKSSQTPLSSSRWTILARGEQEFDAITRCPAGHIQVDYGNLTVRFHQDEFLVFARMVTEAAIHLKFSPLNISHLIISIPSVTWSRN